MCESSAVQEKLLAAAIAPGAAQKQCRYCLSMISPKVLEAPIYCSRYWFSTVAAMIEEHA